MKNKKNSTVQNLYEFFACVFTLICIFFILVKLEVMWAIELANEFLPLIMLGRVSVLYYGPPLIIAAWCFRKSENLKKNKK